MEKIVLELFSRVKEVEEKNADLECRLNSLLDSHKNLESKLEKFLSIDNQIFTENDVNREKEISNKIRRSDAQRFVMEILMTKNKDFIIRKGNRELGCDILIEKNQMIFKANFFHSRNYSQDSLISGWHTVKNEDIENENIHLFIFSINKDSEIYTFIFSRNELIDFIKDKTSNSKEFTYFYFIIEGERIIEARDRTIEKNASQFYNIFDLSKKFRI